MAEREKKTLVEILGDIQFIRGSVEGLDYVESERIQYRTDYISEILNLLSWHIETNLKEID